HGALPVAVRGSDRTWIAHQTNDLRRRPKGENLVDPKDVAWGFLTPAQPVVFLRSDPAVRLEERVARPAELPRLGAELIPIHVCSIRNAALPVRTMGESQEVALATACVRFRKQCGSVAVQLRPEIVEVMGLADHPQL